MDRFTQALDALSAQRLQGIRRGIEKESLRTLADGDIALTSHPVALGSALTHPNITTDFSESQVELITGVHQGVQDCLDELVQVQKFTLGAIGDEMLWVSSMPCCLPPDDDIPIGQYGTSNVGRAKSVYRMGLGYRYGRRMQTISGILCLDSQLPPKRLFVAVPVWRVSCGVLYLCLRAPAPAAVLD
jgi:glutamate--cysteine ligase